MVGTSKWVKWYRILAVIGCGVIVLFSIINGWSEARYTYNYGYDVGHDMPVFFLHAGIGCAIAVVELIVSMMFCEFLDNVSLIANKLSNRDYTKATKDFIDELANNPKTKERTRIIYRNMIEESQSTEKRELEGEEKQDNIERKTTTVNKNHAPVVPIKGNKDKIICPLCKTEQRSNRRLCMNCAAPFITEE